MTCRNLTMMLLLGALLLLGSFPSGASDIVNKTVLLKVYAPLVDG